MKDEHGHVVTSAVCHKCNCKSLQLLNILTDDHGDGKSEDQIMFHD